MEESCTKAYQRELPADFTKERKGSLERHTLVYIPLVRGKHDVYTLIRGEHTTADSGSFDAPSD
jgi:hypothetical protein